MRRKDANVKMAFDKVNECLDKINWDKASDNIHLRSADDNIAKAIYAVDALKSALRAL